MRPARPTWSAPRLIVPIGLALGLSFIGAAWRGDLLRYGHAFEQAGKLHQPPCYLPMAPTGDVLAPLP